MATLTKTMYDTDFVEWTAQTAELLREGRFGELDLKHVVEEIEDLGKGDFKAVRSPLRRMLTLLVKRKIQPGRAGTSWLISMANARREILDDFRYSPSMRQRLSNEVGVVYREAIEDALLETGLAGQSTSLGIPGACPFTLAELLGDRPDLLQL